MAWSRFKQGTREVFGKSEKFTEIPKDIEDLNEASDSLYDIYSELLGTAGIVGSIKSNTTGGSTISHSSSVSHALSGWSKVLAFKMPGGTELDTVTLNFIQKSMDSVKMMEEIRLAFEAELEENYSKTIRDAVKVCKEAKAAYDKVKQNRLELDGKKYRLQNATTNDESKLKHFQNSVLNLEERFEYACNEFRRVVAGLFVIEDFQKLQRGLLATYLKALISYHKRALDKLGDTDRKLDLTGASIFDRSFIWERPLAAPAPTGRHEDNASVASSNDEAGSRNISNASSRNNSSNTLSTIAAHPTVPDTCKKPVLKPPVSTTFPAPPVPNRGNGAKKVIAVYNFEGVENGDLSFVKDDVIEVIKEEGDWWVGQIGSRKGNFPSNYVKPM